MSLRRLLHEPRRPPARATRPPALVALGVLTGALLLATCRDDQGPRTFTEPTTLPAPSFALDPGAVTLVGAGDISSCSHHNDTSTAKLLDAIPGTVFTTGDNAAPSGASTDYANCYNPTWGRQKARTRPAPGDAEYGTVGAAGYFGYFGSAAGDPSKGYYSYDLGTWHVVVLNSNIDMSAGSAQELWLKADLAASSAQCTLAYWHYARFYSGSSTTRASVKPLWDDLYAANAEVVLNSHTRNYERFAPQTPAGALDTVNGIREFVVGTGGLGTWSFYTIAPNSQVRAQVYGVLKLTLNTGSYSWQFVPIAGTQFSDTGATACHGPAGPPPPPPPPTPVVNAGPDLSTYPGVTANLSIAFSDTGATDAPWSYTILWGDGTSSTGSTSSASAPIAASHAYSTLGLDSVRVTVTNSAGRSGVDAVAIRIVAPGTQVALFAGDIADCNGGSTKTAAILDTIAGTVITGGDNAYPGGASADYANCYAPNWGRHLYRTYATVGNHDYGLGNANGTFGYFGAAAGPAGLGYYSFDIGSWHVVVLNSNYTFVPTAVGSTQELWLKSDLAAAAGKCILAVWHHPRFYSSTTSPLSAGTSTLPFWNDLYAAHADVILNGHMHDYERFAPTDPSGNLDLTNGIREIIAGTGGGGTDAPNTFFWPNSQVRISSVYGILKLTLSSSAYSWQFVPATGTVSDSGTTACHNGSAPVNSPPTAAPGGPYSGGEGTAVAFSGAASSDPNGDALTYAWSFGDGGTGTGVAPSHTYADNGTYTVTLTVTDPFGAASTPVTTTATIANVAPSVTLPANQVATAGSAYALSAGFGDPGVSDAPWTYTIDWGDGSPQTTGSTSSQLAAITASHTYAAGGTDTVRVSVTDKDAATGSAKTAVAVAAVNQPPTAVPGGPYTGVEAVTVSFNGGGSSDPDGDALTYAWSFGDGGTGTGATPSHAYGDNGAYTVTLTVTDSKGAASAPVTTTATITNAAPAVTLPANQVATAGSAYTLSATFSDAGVNDGPWGYTIDWGDGSTPTSGSATSPATALTASHTYAAGGTDTVRVTVTDKDGGAGSAKTPVAVAAVNHPPTAQVGGPYAGAEGTAVSFNGSGSSDPDGDALTYAWTFGDGSTGTGANPTHAYADNGSFSVTLAVTDSHGAASAPASTTATITNVAPVLSIPAGFTAVAGSALTVNAAFTDAGANDAAWSYAIDWGDGSLQTSGSKTSQGAITAGHTYAAAGTNTVRVTVTDKDGGTGSGQAIVTVSAAPASVTLLLAGNISRCDRTNDEATAAILDTLPGTVVALGDNAYPNGTPANFQNCYDPSWGRHKTRTYPVVGNHEYDSSATAAGQFGYFGAVAGDPSKGYYSFDLGAWHIVVLNSNSSFVPTAAGSAQELWLKSDLAGTTKQCVLAAFHHPRFYSTTSASFSPTTSVKPFWDDLYAARAELIVNAHMQDYERFAPQTPTGAADPTNGVREIIVGTGGSGLDSPNTLIIPNSEARISGVYGVLKLTLADGSYSWQFVGAGGAGAGESGSGACH